jgi:hypothetical protein
MGTRVVAWSARISWVMIYFVPLFLIIVAFNPVLDTTIYYQLILATVGTYTLYELGYIQNDTVTIRNETEPTLRLDELQQEYVSDYWLVILLVRLLIVAILLGYLSTAAGFLYYLFSLFLVALVFPLYNRRRGAINAALHPLLVIARYCGPLLLVMPEVAVFLYGLLMFPLINGLERARQPRYGLGVLQHLWFADGHSGRWGYYLLMLVFWSGVCLVLDFALLTVLPLAYMFVYRLVSPWLIQQMSRAR